MWTNFVQKCSEMFTFHLSEQEEVDVTHIMRTVQIHLIAGLYKNTARPIRRMSSMVSRKTKLSLRQVYNVIFQLRVAMSKLSLTLFSRDMRIFLRRWILHMHHDAMRQDRLIRQHDVIGMAFDDADSALMGRIPLSRAVQMVMKLPAYAVLSGGSPTDDSPLADMHNRKLAAVDAVGDIIKCADSQAEVSLAETRGLARHMWCGVRLECSMQSCHEVRCYCCGQYMIRQSARAAIRHRTDWSHAVTSSCVDPCSNPSSNPCSNPSSNPSSNSSSNPSSNPCSHPWSNPSDPSDAVQPSECASGKDGTDETLLRCDFSGDLIPDTEDVWSCRSECEMHPFGFDVRASEVSAYCHFADIMAFENRLGCRITELLSADYDADTQQQTRHKVTDLLYRRRLVRMSIAMTASRLFRCAQRDFVTVANEASDAPNHATDHAVVLSCVRRRIARLKRVSRAITWVNHYDAAVAATRHLVSSLRERFETWKQSFDSDCDKCVVFCNRTHKMDMLNDCALDVATENVQARLDVTIDWLKHCVEMVHDQEGLVPIDMTHADTAQAVLDIGTKLMFSVPELYRAALSPRYSITVSASWVADEGVLMKYTILDEETFVSSITEHMLPVDGRMLDYMRTQREMSHLRTQVDDWLASLALRGTRADLMRASTSIDPTTCMCTICQCEMDEGGVRLLCGHSFHASCVQTWMLKHKAECPVCKHNYNSQLSQLQLSTTTLSSSSNDE